MEVVGPTVFSLLRVRPYFSTMSRNHCNIIKICKRPLEFLLFYDLVNNSLEGCYAILHAQGDNIELK